MTPNYLVLSPRAKADLVDLWAYSLASWGNQQEDVYLEKVETAFLNLLEHPKLGRLRCEVLPDVYSLVEEKHVIFYKLSEEAIQVLGVVHQRMEIGSRFP